MIISINSLHLMSVWIDLQVFYTQCALPNLTRAELDHFALVLYEIRLRNYPIDTTKQNFCYMKKARPLS